MKSIISLVIYLTGLVQDLKQCNLNAIDHAFTSDENKTILRQKINRAYKAL